MSRPSFHLGLNKIRNLWKTRTGLLAEGDKQAGGSEERGRNIYVRVDAKEKKKKKKIETKVLCKTSIFLASLRDARLPPSSGIVLFLEIGREDTSMRGLMGERSQTNYAFLSPLSIRTKLYFASVSCISRNFVEGARVSGWLRPGINYLLVFRLTIYMQIQRIPSQDYTLFLLLLLFFQNESYQGSRPLLACDHHRTEKRVDDNHGGHGRRPRVI